MIQRKSRGREERARLAQRRAASGVSRFAVLILAEILRGSHRERGESPSCKARRARGVSRLAVLILAEDHISEPSHCDTSPQGPGCTCSGLF
jgi:hypothetical protein